MPQKHLDVAFIGGPQYDALYSRLPRFERESGYAVDVHVQLPHPALNAHIDETYAAGTATYDVISTHVKYAPAQQQWLLPLDPYFSEVELADFSPALLKLARVEGALVQIPRTVDARILFYRRDLLTDRRNRNAFNASTAARWLFRKPGTRCETSPPISRGRPASSALPFPVTRRPVRDILRAGRHGGWHAL